MKKPLSISIIFILLLFFSCQESKPPKDIQADSEATIDPHLNSIIKNRTRSFTSPGSGNNCLDAFYTYNEKGQIIQKIDYRDCNKVLKKVNYTYDHAGTIAISRIESFQENVTYIWKYNEAGQLIEKVATGPTKIFQYRLIYNYDSLGNRTEYKGMMEDGSPSDGVCRKVYIYDGRKKVKTIYYSGKDFNIQGSIIEHFYDPQNKEVIRYFYQDSTVTAPDTLHISYEYY